MIKTILNTLWQTWKKIAHFLGRINSHVLLSLFYFLIFGLVAIVRKIIKLFSKEIETDSYWIEKKESEEVDFDKQF